MKMRSRSRFSSSNSVISNETLVVGTICRTCCEFNVKARGDLRAGLRSVLPRGSVRGCGSRSRVGSRQCVSAPRASLRLPGSGRSRRGRRAAALLPARRSCRHVLSSADSAAVAWETRHSGCSGGIRTCSRKQRLVVAGLMPKLVASVATSSSDLFKNE